MCESCGLALVHSALHSSMNVSMNSDEYVELAGTRDRDQENRSGVMQSFSLGISPCNGMFASTSPATSSGSVDDRNDPKNDEPIQFIQLCMYK